MFLKLLLFLLSVSASKRKYKDISVDNFAVASRNLLGGDIAYRGLVHSLTTLPAVKLEPTSNGAQYTTQLTSSGCFDASNHASLDIHFVVQHSFKSARFDVAVEFFDATCTISAGIVVVKGPQIDALKAAVISIPREKYDTLSTTTGMSSRLKSISLVNFSFNELSKPMLVFIKTMTFLPAQESVFQPITRQGESDDTIAAVTAPKLEPIAPLADLSQSKGFENDRNTCYIDAVLNAMFLQSHAFDYLLSPLRTENADLIKLQTSLRRIVNTMRSSTIVLASTMNAFVMEMVACEWPFILGAQEDAGEFFTILLDKLEAATIPLVKTIHYYGITESVDREASRIVTLPVGPSNEDTRIYDVLRDSLHYTLKGLTREIQGHARNISADVTTYISPFLAREVVTTQSSESEPSSQEEMPFVPDPRVTLDEMVIPMQLMRFNSSGFKLHTTIALLPEMEVTDLMVQRLGTRYKLVLESIVMHTGESHLTGHYSTFVKHRTRDEWMSLDDASVPKKVKGTKKMFKLIAKSGYLLFYRLIAF